MKFIGVRRLFYSLTFAVLSAEPVANCLSLKETATVLTSLSCVFNVNSDDRLCGWSASNVTFSSDHTLAVVS